MDTALKEFIGKKVSIYSNQPGAERQDVGVLEYADTQWVKLRKTENEIVYFGVPLIRMVKLFNT